MKNNIEMDIKNIYNDILELFNQDTNIGVETLYNALKHHFKSKGKMLRPMFMLMVNDDLGGNKEDVIKFAMALELIHNYSLIHDDLPSMDNDDYRRGQLTVHKKFDEATAVLAGDYLLTKAFEVISMGQILSKPENYLKAINVLAYNSNDFGMIGGQVLDLNTEFLNSKENILKMYELKTSALFKSSFLIPGVLCGLDSEELEILESIGRDFGILFQIKDDISDREEDEKANKTTLLNYLDYSEVESILDNMYKSVLFRMEKLGLEQSKEKLKELYG